MGSGEVTQTQGNAVSRVPPELFDAVINAARHDKRLLATCSLVCRTWVPASRCHLFRCILLRANNVAQFREVLQSPHATIPRYIRNLAIRSRTLHTFFWNDTQLLSKFSSIEVLQLEDIRCNHITSLRRGILYNAFQTITALKFCNCLFDAINSLTDILCFFPVLTDLALHDVRWMDDEHVVLAPPGSQLSLHNLDIQGRSTKKFLTWITSFNPLPPIRVLCFRCIRTSEDIDPALHELIKTLGPSLESLDFDEDEFPVIVPVDLVRNTQLCTLCIEFELGYDDPFSVNRIRTLLSQISSSRLEKVTFRTFFAFKVYEAPEDLHLQELDQFLCRPQFARLQEINFLMPSNRPDLREKIEIYMPSCQSRGILFVIFELHSAVNTSAGEGDDSF